MGSGQCDIPALEDGTWYTHVVSGGRHTILCRSDGAAVACGVNAFGQCNIPPLKEGVIYRAVGALSIVLQARIVGSSMLMFSLSGEEEFRFDISETDCIVDIPRRVKEACLACDSGEAPCTYEIILPD